MPSLQKLTFAHAQRRATENALAELPVWALHCRTADHRLTALRTELQRAAALRQHHQERLDRFRPAEDAALWRRAWQVVQIARQHSAAKELEMAVEREALARDGISRWSAVYDACQRRVAVAADSMLLEPPKTMREAIASPSRELRRKLQFPLSFFGGFIVYLSWFSALWTLDADESEDLRYSSDVSLREDDGG